MLIAIYTMLGTSLYEHWYQQPMYLLAGAVWYNVLTLVGHLLFPVRLRQQNSLVTEKILFMLEGAIIGIHEAALPVARRQELAEWADSLTPKQEFPAELE